jgi:signal transduction histidine kinase
MAEPDETASVRIERLEELVSHLRHDIRGAISSTSLIADVLAEHGDPSVQRAAKRIATTVERVTTLLNATLELVPPNRR